MPSDERYAPEDFHRKLAVDLFNETWTYLDKESRTPEEEDEMLHRAFASRYHWGVVGEPVNFARGEWQISRVYAVLYRTDSALYHGQRCLDICEKNGIGDFDLAFAYEAIARAHALAGRHEESAEALRMAKDAGEKIGDKEDRDYFFADLATIPGRGA